MGDRNSRESRQKNFRRNYLKIGNTVKEYNINNKYTFVVKVRKVKILIDYKVYRLDLIMIVQRMETIKELEIESNHRQITPNGYKTQEDTNSVIAAQRYIN